MGLWEGTTAPPLVPCAAGILVWALPWPHHVPARQQAGPNSGTRQSQACWEASNLAVSSELAAADEQQQQQQPGPVLRVARQSLLLQQTLRG